MKLWAGRFSEQSDKRLDDFNSSISFDCRMYRQDIGGSIAHATMLAECGVIAKEDSEAIIEGLEGILHDIESGKLPFKLAFCDQLTVPIGNAVGRDKTIKGNVRVRPGRGQDILLHILPDQFTVLLGKGNRLLD